MCRVSDVADLIGAVASLLWPLLVIVALLVFGGQLLSKLRSSADVTLEIGGQRLNFKQAADQQADMISDLQLELASLKRRLEAAEQAPPGGATAVPADEDPADGAWGSGDQPAPGSGTSPRSILWVDDHPENNVMLAETWRRDGILVETARSTADALRLLDRQRYALVISDMVRTESGVEVPDAGLQLLYQVRARDAATPFALYGNVGLYADAARAAGVTLVTRSTFELVEYVSGLGIVAS